MVDLRVISRQECADRLLSRLRAKSKLTAKETTKNRPFTTEEESSEEESDRRGINHEFVGLGRQLAVCSKRK